MNLLQVAKERLLKETDWIPYAKDNPFDKFILYMAWEIWNRIPNVDMDDSDWDQWVQILNDSEVKVKEDLYSSARSYSDPKVNKKIVAIAQELYNLHLTSIRPKSS